MNMIEKAIMEELKCMTQHQQEITLKIVRELLKGWQQD